MRCVALAILLVMIGTAPRAETEPWAQELTQQMLEDENCKVTFITRVRERETSDGALIEALVGCTDRRTFFVYREKGQDKFDITAPPRNEKDC